MWRRLSRDERGAVAAMERWDPRRAVVLRAALRAVVFMASGLGIRVDQEECVRGAMRSRDEKEIRLI